MANGAGLPVWAKEALKYLGAGGGIGAAVLVVWIAIAQPMREDFRDAAKKADARMESLQVQNAEAARKAGERMDALKDEFTRFRSDFTEWTRQVFVSRDLYDQRRAETDRRLSMVEDAVKELVSKGNR